MADLSVWIADSSIVPDRYTDSVSGDAADLNNGNTDAFCVIHYEVLDPLPSYTISVQISSNGIAWDDSDADPENLTAGPGVAVLKFTRSVRYARASLNVVDGPGDIRLGCEFLTAEPAVGEVVPVELVYDPQVPAPSELQEVRIYCGSGMNIKFAPEAPTSIAASEYWEVRVGQLYSSASEPPTILSYKVATGNLTVDVDTGDIIADLAANETEDLDPSPSVRTFVELWRIGVGDDNTGPVARAIAKVIDTVRPAP
jgi:hypothetical protein